MLHCSTVMFLVLNLNCCKLVMYTFLCLSKLIKYYLTKQLNFLYLNINTKILTLFFTVFRLIPFL